VRGLGIKSRAASGVVNNSSECSAVISIVSVE